MLHLKGLQKVISVNTSKPEWGVINSEGRKGWVFDKSHSVKGLVDSYDSLHGCDNVSQLYHKVDPNYTAKYTVPLLWDKKNNTIVNNESSEIIRMLNDSFQEFALNKEVDLFPKRLAK